MDKNTITGLVLIALLFMVFNLLVEPPPPAESGSVDSTTTTQTTNNPNITENQLNSNTSKPVKNLPGVFVQADDVSEKFTTLENDKLKVTFSNKGGRIYKAEVKDYVTSDKESLILLDGTDNRWGYNFFLKNYPISTQNYFFETVQTTSNSVTFRLYADSTSYIDQIYTLDEKDNNLVNYDLNIIGFDDLLPNNTGIELAWANQLRQQEKSLSSERNTTTIYYKERNDDADYLSETSDEAENISFTLDWVAFKQQFFNTTLIAEKGFQRAKLATYTPAKEDNSFLKQLTAEVGFEYKQTPTFSFPMKMYMGPNHYQTLKSFDNDMQAMIPLGWGIFGWVNKLIIIPMFNFLHSFISNYGIIILVLTLVIKFALFPLTRKSYMSFAKMNALKPELEALKQKHAKDKQKLQAEQMKLYSTAGVNPLGGCLPQLLQLPILIAMYRFFPASIELRQEAFLWADDLSTYDSILDLPFTIPFYGDHVSLFCLLSAFSSLIYTRLNNQMSPTAGSDDMAKQMRMFQYIMPFMLIFIFNSFSAGLTFYFFLSTIISFGQQIVIKRFFINEDKIREQLKENQKKPVKKSKFQQRLEDMVKAQQEQQKQATQQRKNKTKKNRRK